jgi:hypothetical protein
MAQFEFQAGTHSWQTKITPQLRQDLLTDQPSDNLTVRLREAYIEWFSDNWDIRIGRQIIVSNSSITSPGSDFFSPLDLSEFLAQDLTDIQLGITAATVRYFQNNNTLEFILVPVFERTILPEASSRWNLLPLNALTGGVSPSGPDLNSPSGRNMQAAFSLRNRSFLTWDLNLSLFHGYFPLPSLKKEVSLSAQTGIPDDILLRYNYDRTSALRGTIEHRLADSWILGSELTLWTNRLFDTFPEQLTNGTTVNLTELLDVIDEYNSTAFQQASPLINVAFSVQNTVFSTLLQLQYQIDVITEHRSDMLQDKLFQSVDFTATRNLMNDYLQMRLSGRFHINGNDFWINPDLTYTLFDGLTIGAGSQFFAGSVPDPLYAHLSFYQFKQNSFTYLKLTAYW